MIEKGGVVPCLCVCQWSSLGAGTRAAEPPTPFRSARGTRASGCLRPHTEFSSWTPGFSPRGDGSLAGSRSGGDGSPSVAARSKCWVRPDPGECHFLGKENSWTLPDPGNCHVLEKTTSWKRSRPGNYHILQNTTSWTSPRPRQCHILKAREQILENATSWRRPNPGNCQIRGKNKSWREPHPGKCHILENAKRFIYSVLTKDTLDEKGQARDTSTHVTFNALNSTKNSPVAAG